MKIAMGWLSLLLVGMAASTVHADDPVLWSLDQLHAGDLKIRGDAELSQGVVGKCLALNGDTVIEAKGFETALQSGEFTFTIWVNPYSLNRGQQMIAAKNRYSLNEREWSLMVDRDGRFRLYVWQEGWHTADGPMPKIGHWYQLTMVVKQNEVEFWVNGTVSRVIKLDDPIQPTDALLTFGGVNDDGRMRQTLLGAVDEARMFRRALTSEEVAALYQPTTSTHEIPALPPLFTLWDEESLLEKANDLPQLSDVEFHVIKKWDQPRDGYKFLHGVGLAWHKGKLFASIGHNRGSENTVTEEAQCRVSDDGGKSWGPLQIIDAGKADVAVSHGVFLSHQSALWAFHGAYYGRMERVHTRAYRLDESTGKWQSRGVVVEDGFWPMNQPVRMDDGNWIMPGFVAKRYSSEGVFPAAVAISHGDDFTQWDFVRIPVGGTVRRMWGESSLFVSGKQVFNIARYGGAAAALVATSDDYGRTWTASAISNLPMATSKPAAGVLSTGQRYLVCTTAKDNGGNRAPLTIAVSRPHENTFSRVFVIRHSVNAGQPGETADKLSLSYPCAIEHEGKLYVGYSNNGGRRGNLNSAELAVIPIGQLKLE